MDKIAKARSKRKDPVQEDILEKKDFINERTTRLIDFMKELKKGWNGNPAPDVGVDQKFSITEPLPDQVVSSGQTALQELSQILEGLKEVNTLQDSYSEERNQRLADRIKQFQKVNASSDDVITKTASNILSRFWQHIKAPFSFESNKWDRLRLLRALGKLDGNLKELDQKVLEGNESIVDSIYLARQLYSDAKSSFFEEFQTSLTEALDTAQKEYEKLDKFVNKEVKPTINPEKIQTSTRPTKDKITIPDRDGNIKGIETEKPVEIKQETNSPPRKHVQNILTIPSVEQVTVAPENATPPVIAPTVEFIDEEPKKPIVEENPKEELPIEVKQEPTVEHAIINEPKEIIPEPIKEEIVKPKEEPPPESKPLSLVKIKKPTEKLEKKRTTRKLTPNVPGLLQPDPIALKKELTDKFGSYVAKTSNELYKTYYRPKVSKYINEPWKSEITDQNNKINDFFISIKSENNSKALFIKFSNFLKSIGVVKELYELAGSESAAQEVNPELTPGSLRLEKQIQTSAKRFANPYEAEAMKLYSEAASIKQANVIEEIEKIAAPNTLQRLLTNLSPSRDKNIRLRVAREITNARQGLQNMMDNLERKNINFKSLISQSGTFYNSIIDVFDKLADLADSYNAKTKLEKAKGNTKKSTISQIDINYLRTIRNKFEKDSSKIKDLEKIEEQIVEISKNIVELQSKEQNAE